MIGAWSCLTERRAIHETERDGDRGRKAQRRCAVPSAHLQSPNTTNITPTRGDVESKKYKPYAFSGGGEKPGLPRLQGP
jgi:hypothetical protein